MTYEFAEDIRAFLQEKKYLQNVSPQTIVLYETSFKAFYGAMEPKELKQRVVELRERGIKPVSVNTYLRHIKTFYLWKGLTWELPWLKEEERLLETLSADRIRSLVNRKAAGTNLARARLIALVICDCGLRASEVLSITTKDVDLNQCCFKVIGKGGKHRVVPFSFELRKHIYREVGKARGIVFGTRNNTKVSVRNLERDFAKLGSLLGFRLAPHMCRHSFAVNYLRNGGNLEYLRRILGHSSVLTTQRYLRSLGVEDLGTVHNGLSPLSARR